MSGHRVAVVDKGGLKVIGDSFAEVLQTRRLGVEDSCSGEGGWVLLMNEWRIVGGIVDVRVGRVCGGRGSLLQLVERRRRAEDEEGGVSSKIEIPEHPE
jgi:hypothetical protein